MNPWIQFLKSWAKSNKMTFAEAMQDPNARVQYHQYMKPKRQSRIKAVKPVRKRDIKAGPYNKKAPAPLRKQEIYSNGPRFR